MADLADRVTLTGQLLAGLARPRVVHDPGRVLVDLAVADADGAKCISDVAVLADQPALFGPASVLISKMRFGSPAAAARMRCASVTVNGWISYCTMRGAFASVAGFRAIWPRRTASLSAVRTVRCT